MRFDNHPFNQVLELVKGTGCLELELEYSIYKYQPQSIFDIRATRNINFEGFSSGWLESVLSGLTGDEELALHSKIKQGKKVSHIPFIDLACSVEDIDLAKSSLRKVLPSHIYSGLIFYDSGRSLHAYGSCFLTKKKWIEFMGRILLSNFPDSETIVDNRWVGHRLLGGFSSLRWSSNSGHYQKLPEKILSGKNRGQARMALS